MEKRLAALRTANAEKLPAIANRVMKESVEDLRADGVLGRVVEVGARAPLFTLPTSDGSEFSLQTALTRGPVVVSFFRGSW